MKFGITFFPTVGPEQTPAVQYFEDALRLAGLADELGFHHVRTVEHYFFTYGGYSPDPVTFLSAVAGRTTNVRLGTSAVIPAFTHPVKLAGKLAMLDNISKGRLDVGFGRAFLPDEFAAFGISLDESRPRFDEGIAAAKLLWSGENVTWAGEFYRFGPVTLLPRPVQQPHPPVFVTTARSVESCEAAGLAGHNLMLVPAILQREQIQERLAVFRDAWVRGGRAAGTEQIQFSYPAWVADSTEEAHRIGRYDEERNGAALGAAVSSWAKVTSAQYPGYEKLADQSTRLSFEAKLAENKVLAGTPAQVRAQLEQIAEWYGDDLTLSLAVHSGHLAAEHGERTLRLFAEQVAPKLSTTT
ncbi:LLM class flavin-dependent oxidoreductase [Catellatospora tritici]|uniref:LLM class flavin-dependent oxidoreductase n=1 Tax=Catellatospora tritici TaxID=2851566 RepID=UPI001C2DA5D5|nr:LLM class flavin-dependent oxidoreductase [Catellatospora tritici]MBV1855600.1 LLM class flavin-dependent oxidoreductase [Catellatospora tritici]